MSGTTTEAQLRAITNSVRDAIVAADASGRVVLWNRAACGMFGYDDSEMSGRLLEDLMPERYRELHRAGLARVAAGGESRLVGKLLALHGLRRDGSEFPLELSIGVWEQGGETFFSGVMRDQTDELAAADRARSLEEQLRQTHRMEALGRLAGGIAHDFNNLLTAIGAHAELIEQDVAAGSELAGDVAEIRRAVRRASELTRSLLAYSRKQLVRWTVADLNSVVEESVKMLRHLIGDDIVIDLRLDPGAGAVAVDTTQLEQCVVNLALNARDAMSGGGSLVVSTGVATLDSLPRSVVGASEEAFASGRYARVTVADSGVGMDADTRSRAFEPFFTTKPFGAGTGLGLSIVYGFVKQAGGHVSIDSEPGRGTTVTLYLPQSSSDVDEIPADVASDHRGGGETILLVDDEPAIRSAAARMLARAGYKVRVASHAAEALALARRDGSSIDLLLTDVVMPGLNGRELAETLTIELPRLRVLYMSGYTGDDVLRRGVKAGHALIQKPFSGSALLGAVREALDTPARLDGN